VSVHLYVDIFDVLRRDSYVLLQGLSGTGSGFLQAVPLLMYYVKITLLGSTPRSVYRIKYSPRTSMWGTLFPAMTQLVVITFGYSIISPIINGLALAAFFLFYLLYKYLFTWVNDQPRSSETGGLFFPKAIQHLFVGLYVQQVCLCALFFLARDANKAPSAIPEGALMVVLIVFTASITQRPCLIMIYSFPGQAIFQNIILNSYGPLLKFLPLSLADRSYGGVEVKPVKPEEEPTKVGVPSHVLSGDVKAIDYANTSTSASDSYQRSGEGGSSHTGDADSHTLERVPSPIFTNESRASSPSPSVKSAEDQGTTDFRHPAAVEEQRIIWLPRDRLGLVDEILQDLASQDILHSTDGAEMNDKGHVNVTTAPPEDVQRNRMEVAPLPSPDEVGGFDLRDAQTEAKSPERQ
jgi:hypothetical protein